MAKGTRKGISKKIRFEVFKRDSFTCQYCGRSAPDVVLHVDHINPVANGGENDIFNYITSCEDCNHGKGAVKLDDSSELKRQKAELDKLNKKREQLEMLVVWRQELVDINNQELGIFDDALSSAFNSRLTETGKKPALALIKKYGLKDVLDAVDIASNAKSVDKLKLLEYLSAICRNRIIQKQKPYMVDLFYVNGILRKRIHDYTKNKYRIMPYLERLFLSGVDIEDMKSAACNSGSLSKFASFFEINPWGK